MRHALQFLSGLLLAAIATAALCPAQAEGHFVRLRIVDCDGKSVSSATVATIRAFPNRGISPPSYHVIWDSPDRALVPRDFTNGIAILDRLPPGRLALQVRADQHAPAVSVAFELPHQRGDEITVRLTRGAVFEGVVKNAAGKPVAAAEVRTVLPEDSSRVLRTVGWFEPVLITRTETQTDAHGRYRIAYLAHGVYRITVAHPDHCSMRRDVMVTDDETVTVPEFTLPAGTVVEGTATWNGLAVAGISVTLLAEDTGSGGAEPDGLQHPAWSQIATVTDEFGNYIFPRRVPAGDWITFAWGPSDADPFSRLANMEDTRLCLVIRADDTTVRTSFQILDRR